MTDNKPPSTPPQKKPHPAPPQKTIPNPPQRKQQTFRKGGRGR